MKLNFRDEDLDSALPIFNRISSDKNLGRDAQFTFNEGQSHESVINTLGGRNHEDNIFSTGTPYNCRPLVAVRKENFDSGKKHKWQEAVVREQSCNYYYYYRICYYGESCD
ncbi:unnamed protein product [Cyprideis torosa]|uniref:Uncharacterized protein n=1 Tax=Cyprideis torosa TaxID=163714 RepID=A0A7R8W8P7_9CRUS|nr:unnamed protein product [Cyprideis torosa]CAG0888788.1 unnamed protein product [Cyprideis torosa]